MTRHELLRERWKENPRKFEAARYEHGCPVPCEQGWEWREWPENSDMKAFGREAAKAMLEEDEFAFPLDICDFATVLRRRYILDTLGLPADPESLHAARLIEMLKAKEMGRFLSTSEAMEAIAEFCLKMADARHLHELSEGQKLDWLDILENKCLNAETVLNK